MHTGLIGPSIPRTSFRSPPPMTPTSRPPRLKVPPLRLFHLLVALGLCAVVGGCTAAGRTNARLEPGWGGAVGFGAATVERAHRVDSGPPRPGDLIVVPNLQGEVQYAWTSPEGTGTAVAARVPLVFILASLDVYRQFSGSERWSTGAGIELGLQGGPYVIVTRHFGPKYLTLTARALTPIKIWSNNWRRDDTSLLPQLSFGHLGRRDWSVFLMYARTLGAGLACGGFNSDLECPQWLVLGTSIRF
jgi:hypothetical protein